VIDQHAWMDPKKGIVYVEEHCPGPARFRRCLRLQGARGRLRQGAAGTRRLDADRNDFPAAKRRVISSRDLLEYLAKAYGITLISIYGWTNKSEPSAAEVSRLARQIEQEHVRALFLDNITDPRIMQRIAKETGAAIGGTLYGDALSKPGGEADTYIRMLRYGVTTLKAGMLKN
jgi:zinc/manganese transport system substrate-binding protein